MICPTYCWCCQAPKLLINSIVGFSPCLKDKVGKSGGAESGRAIHSGVSY
jgi:hypothetical protein